jgi:glycosyltransferase involved in cell wall biosynthesis
LKILFNTYQLAFQHPGGGEVVILKLKEHLESLGHSVDLFDKWQHKISDYELIHDFACIDWEIWKYYSDLKIPFVLTPTAWPKIDPLTTLKTTFKAKLKAMFQNNTPPFSLYHYIALPDVICPTTSLEKERLMLAFSEKRAEKFTVIPNGVELPSENLKSDTSLSKKLGDTPFCLFVGNLAPNKNPLRAIEMAKAQKIKIFLIGDHKEENIEYYQQLKKHESPEVVFLGRLTHDSELLKSAYQKAEAILIPSNFETCSLVALEAGVHGTPVVITKEGGTTEIFKNQVQYIAPTDLEDCIEGLRMALLKKGFDQELKDFISSEYSWRSIARRYEKIYRELLRAR